MSFGKMLEGLFSGFANKTTSPTQRQTATAPTYVSRPTEGWPDREQQARADLANDPRGQMDRRLQDDAMRNCERQAADLKARALAVDTDTRTEGEKLGDRLAESAQREHQRSRSRDWP
ncbi:unnamed protein product [marine sediment metagenome]|uniref:Uncharacterized protein n=1 Tax=marine sediment metagenome TaxID=412755 RepID=X1CFG6_9ZZZZ